MKFKNTTVFILIFSSIFLLLASCRSGTQNVLPDEKPDSTGWIINADEFITYHTFITETNEWIMLSGASENQNKGSFSITFQLSEIPTENNFHLNCEDKGEQSVCMEIIYQDVKYRAKQENLDFLKADFVNKKAKLILPTTWFYNNSLQNDSIAVSGQFIQP